MTLQLTDVLEFLEMHGIETHLKHNMSHNENLHEDSANETPQRDFLWFVVY